MGSFSNHAGGEYKWGITFIGEGKSRDFYMPGPEPGLNDLWIGILPETWQAFVNWIYSLEEHDIPSSYLENLQANGVQYFNQGDAFFSNATNTKLPVAEVGGETLEPTINKLIKDTKNYGN